MSVSLFWFIDDNEGVKSMATTKFNKKKYTQIMVFMDRNLNEIFKRKCKELGLSPKNLLDNYSDEFLKTLIEKLDNRDEDLLNLSSRRKVIV